MQSYQLSYVIASLQVVELHCRYSRVALLPLLLHIPLRISVGFRVPREKVLGQEEATHSGENPTSHDTIAERRIRVVRVD